MTDEIAGDTVDEILPGTCLAFAAGDGDGKRHGGVIGNVHEQYLCCRDMQDVTDPACLFRERLVDKPAKGIVDLATAS